MIAIIAKIIHGFAHDMEPQPTDRTLFHRQADIGGRCRKRIESRAIVHDFNGYAIRRLAQADVNGWFGSAASMDEDVAGDFIQSDQNLRRRSIRNRMVREKLLRSIQQGLQARISIGQGAAKFCLHDTDRSRRQGGRLRGFSLIEWKNFTITT